MWCYNILQTVSKILRHWYKAILSITIIIESWHKISNNVVCSTGKASDQPAHTHSLIRAFASRLNILWVLSVKLLTEQHFKFLRFKVDCTCSSVSTLVKMPHSWESHVMFHIIIPIASIFITLVGKWYLTVVWAVICKCGIYLSYSLS